MVPNPSIMQAVESLGYRVTVGDVAIQAGMQVDLAQRELMVLASEAGGHLQVAESGDIAFQFPPNFRTVLRNQYVQIRLREWWEKVWRVLFYLIRISFGIVLILLIVLTVLAIIIINSSRSEDDRRDNRSDGGGFMVPNFWISDLFWIFSWGDPRPDYQPHRHQEGDGSQLNFLESVFSFLFGDGFPNQDLDERRWQAIATTIRNHQGAVIAEQISPYLDEIGEGFKREYEEYMLPVLVRFNGVPEVSPEGQIVYHFPDLQSSAGQQRQRSVSAYLKEHLWRFSQASAGQRFLAAGLGGLLFGLSLFLGASLPGTGEEIERLISLLAQISFVYSSLYLSIPVLRYGWILWRNQQIEHRNHQRQARAMTLNHGDEVVQKKLQFAQSFAAQSVVSQNDLAYTTETGLTEQELAQADRIDADWQRRLDQS
ncbi:MAG: hypothetical protein VKL00_10660 [Synechococcales bacterium]|nr:hypothetical protein [Cyanobacteria bacterium REEB444]MEB3126066.1 hypothetical protein [Synechococcales bacterium]